MIDMYIKVYGFMIRRLVGKAEMIKTLLLTYKFKLLTYLVTEIMNLSSLRIFYLVQLTNHAVKLIKHEKN